MPARAVVLVALVLVLSSVLVPAPSQGAARPDGLPSPVPLGVPHAAIGIYSNAEFTAANGVTGGSGTATDPYRIEGWTIDATQYVGLSVQDTTAYFVVRNITIDNGPTSGMGVYFSNVRHGRVESSRFAGNLSALQIWNGFGGIPEGSDDIAIVNNTFDLTSEFGLTVAASNLTVSGNTIEMEQSIPPDTYALLAEGPDNVIGENRIVSAGMGVIVTCTNAATVRGNVITAEELGLDVLAPSGVHVYGNDFLQGGAGEGLPFSGVPECSSNPPVREPNTWDDGYPAGGNFWIGYAGADRCSGPAQDQCSSGDGIGDTPQPVPGSFASDRYPLMRPSYRDGLAFTYKLYGSAMNGWGFTPATMSNPGPTLVAFVGAPLRLDLAAADGMYHTWFVDRNNNSVPDAGEPSSPQFDPAHPATFTFIPSSFGVFVYRCSIHPATMWGMLLVLSPLGYMPHAPIVIHGDRDFTPTNGVVQGNGSAQAPYVIEGWAIETSYEGIEIMDTTAHVVVRDLLLSNRTCQPDGSSCGFLGILFLNVSHAEIRSIVVTNMSRGAMALAGVHDVVVADSVLEGGDSVLAVSMAASSGAGYLYSSDVVIEGNEATCAGSNPNAYGIVANGTRLTIRDNVVRCPEEGIYLDYATDVLVTHNAVVGAGAGLVAFTATNVSWVANDVVDLKPDPQAKYPVGSAFYLYDTTDAVVRDNLFRSDGAIALTLYLSSWVHVDHNNILGNPIATFDAPGADFWDAGYPSGGNYWSDYKGVDQCRGPQQTDCTGSDGLGDTPRSVYGGTVDRYPLMEPLALLNAFPHAVLAATPSVGNLTTPFVFNASASVDPQDATAKLQMRWDWTDDGSWDTPWSTVQLATHHFGASGDVTVRVAVRDPYGLEDQATVTVLVDAAPPAVTLHLSGTAGEHGWYRSAVTVDIQAVDSLSGVASVQARVDFGAWRAVPGPFPLSDGSHVLEYRATDRAGNVGPVARDTIRVDAQAPEVRSLAPAGVVTSSVVPISWEVRDNTSGVARYELSVDGSAFGDVGNASDTLTLADGVHTVTLRATDVAGNNVTQTATFRVDTNPFSFSGPLAGIPTVLTIAVVVAAAFVLWYRRRPKGPAGNP